MNILLDYFFPVTAISPIAQASTAFLKQACVVVKPNAGNTGNTGNVYLCTAPNQVSTYTDNTDSSELFNAGLNKVYVLLSDDLDLESALNSNPGLFYTLLISSDFVDGDLVGLKLGAFKGVTGYSSNDVDTLKVQSKIANRCAFYADTGKIAKNMFFSFGKLLSNPLNWLNQQYITVPESDAVSTLGDANNLFDEKISFVISDDEFSERLALFACGGKAIVAPYIERNLEIDLQSKALSYVAGNMPAYTKTQGALLEDELTKVIDSYIERQWIELGKVEIKLEQDNFVASGYINIREPRALWRVFGQLKQTL